MKKAPNHRDHLIFSEDKDGKEKYHNRKCLFHSESEESESPSAEKKSSANEGSVHGCRGKNGIRRRHLFFL